jgi:hypothetical protein
MTPTNVFDAAQLIAAAGTAVAIVVQLVVMFASPEPPAQLKPRAKVATAVVAAAVLTALYALSYGLLVAANAFGLAIAAITIAAAGAGAQHAITTTAATP